MVKKLALLGGAGLGVVLAVRRKTAARRREEDLWTEAVAAPDLR